ncbi:MAG: hypothetical protein AB7O73_12625 [Bacteroidia bacterium]
MKSKIDIENELLRFKIKSFKHEEDVVNEAYKILNRDLFLNKKVLDNLKLYNKSFEFVDEDESDPLSVFTEQHIQTIAIKYRLKFLDSQKFKKDIPFEAIEKIKAINHAQKKDIKHFKILAPIESFIEPKKDVAIQLFAQTDHNNYLFIHSWGDEFPWYRKLLCWPIRRFETLFATVILISAILACSLPTKLIWLPEGADYWGTYRVGAFFHILIFNMGVTAYFTFALGKNFSTKSWNKFLDLY